MADTFEESPTPPAFNHSFRHPILKNSTPGWSTWLYELELESSRILGVERWSPRIEILVCPP